MNYYWHTPQGKVVQTAIGATLEEVEASPLSLEYGFVESAARYSPDDVYVAGGGLIEKPARPSPSHAWDYEAAAWIDPRTLADLKAAKWAEIRAARDAAEFGGFTWDGDDFDSDGASQARIMGAVQMATLAAMAEQPFSIEWTLATNIVRTLDGAGMVAVGLALGAHVAQQHETGRSLRAAIDACTTAAEVEAISWP